MIIIGSLSHVFFPRFCWWLHCGWQYRDSDVEPSDLYLLMTRIGGLLFIPIALVALHVFKISEPFHGAMERVKTSPEVIQTLGSPVKIGLFLSANEETQNGEGKADMTVPVSGPNGEGIVHLKAYEWHGEWDYSELLLRMKGSNQLIDILPAGKFSASQPKPTPPASVNDPELDQLQAKAQQEYQQLLTARNQLDTKDDKAVTVFNQTVANYNTLLAKIEQHKTKAAETHHSLP